MQDYILRLIEQFAGAIASIASRRRQGERKEARQEAELLAPSLLGVELDLLAFYGQEKIREEILSLGGDVEARLRLASQFLFEVAALEEEEGQKTMACQLRSLAVFLQGV